MSGAQKFSLSLLISVVIFSGFAVLAWSGLFDYIETSFYLDRVQSSVQGRVDTIAERVDAFHRANLDRFAAVLAQDSVRRTFSVNQAREDIVERTTYFDELELRLPSLDYVRFVDLGGHRIHFSTRATDFAETSTGRTYLPIVDIEVSEPYPLSQLAYPEADAQSTERLVGPGLPAPDILLVAEDNQFIYRFPVLDEFGVLQGAALFYVNSTGLSTALVRDGLVGSGDSVDLISVKDTAYPDGAPSGGILVNAKSRWAEAATAAISASWTAIVAEERPVLTLGESADFTVFARMPVEESTGQFLVLYAFPTRDLEMTDVMKIVLLAAVFLTVFLLVFLLFNLRQDAVVVMADRVKRFQISLLREYVQGKQEIDFQKWKMELESRRAEVASQIRRGIGRVRPSQREEIDKLIESSWDEILDVLGSRASEPDDRGIDLNRLEDIIERVISNLQEVGPAQPGLAAAPRIPTQTGSPRHVPLAVGGEPVEVEEVGEDELGEVEELGEPVEVEEVGEDEPGEAEELGEPVEVEEVGEDELGEAEELGEPVEVEEVGEDELGEAEELGEPVEAGLEEPAGADIRLFNESAELEMVGSAELLAGDEVSLEDLDVDAAEGVPKLEGELISDTADADEIGEPEEGAVVREIDLKAAESTTAGTVRDEETVEELAVADAEETGDLGSLEAAATRPSAFATGTFTFGKGPPIVAGPRSGDRPASAVEPEEELETLEVLPSASDAAPSGPARTREVRGQPVSAPLVAEGPIRFADIRSLVAPEYEIATISDILDRLHVDKGVLTDHDGLVEIDEKVYTTPGGGGDSETRELIESVIGPDEDSATAGVEELFGTDSEDLFADLSPISQQAVGEVEARQSLVRFSDRGFDYDGFLRGYKKTEGGIIKSLVTFTRYWNARVGVLLGESDAEMVPKHGLGIEESCLRALRVSHSSGIYRNIFGKRLVLYVDRPLRQVEYFLGLCPDEHFVYFQKVLFLPVILQGAPAYAVLGLSERVENLESAFGAIVPHLTSVGALVRGT